MRNECAERRATVANGSVVPDPNPHTRSRSKRAADEPARIEMHSNQAAVEAYSNRDAEQAQIEVLELPYDLPRHGQFAKASSGKSTLARSRSWTDNHTEVEALFIESLIQNRLCHGIIVDTDTYHDVPRGRVGHVSWTCPGDMLVPRHACPKCVLSVS